jgi:hypothetical protein
MVSCPAQVETRHSEGSFCLLCLLIWVHLRLSFLKQLCLEILYGDMVMPE